MAHQDLTGPEDVAGGMQGEHRVAKLELLAVRQPGARRLLGDGAAAAGAAPGSQREHPPGRLGAERAAMPGDVVAVGVAHHRQLTAVAGVDPEVEGRQVDAPPVAHLVGDPHGGPW